MKRKKYTERAWTPKKMKRKCCRCAFIPSLFFYVRLLISFCIHANRNNLKEKKMRLVRLVINLKTVCLWWNECVLEQVINHWHYCWLHKWISTFFFKNFLSYIINAVHLFWCVEWHINPLFKSPLNILCFVEFQCTLLLHGVQLSLDEWKLPFN